MSITFKRYRKGNEPLKPLDIDIVYGMSPAMQALPLINQPRTLNDLKSVMKLIEDEEQD